SGGCGTVYAGEAADGAPVAIKVLHRELLERRDALARFEREILTTQRLRHSALVQIFAHGALADGRPYFVMERLTGQGLEAHLAAATRLPPEGALTILTPVCEALALAHEAGVIHRDIKASNVFVCDAARGGRVVLLDFGVAKLLLPDEAGLTTSRQTLGTPGCMAPEQIRGGAIDARTDVYALGVLLYHMVTGEIPFAQAVGAGEPTLLEHMHVRAGRPLPSARVEVSRELDAVVTTAMSIEPESRYPSAQAFLEALRAATTGGPTLDRGVAAGGCRASGLLRERRAGRDAVAGGGQSVRRHLARHPPLDATSPA